MLVNTKMSDKHIFYASELFETSEATWDYDLYEKLGLQIQCSTSHRFIENPIDGSLICNGFIDFNLKQRRNGPIYISSKGNRYYLYIQVLYSPPMKKIFQGVISNCNEVSVIICDPIYSMKKVKFQAFSTMDKLVREQVV